MEKFTAKQLETIKGTIFVMEQQVKILADMKDNGLSADERLQVKDIVDSLYLYNEREGHNGNGRYLLNSGRALIKIGRRYGYPDMGDAGSCLIDLACEIHPQPQ